MKLIKSIREFSNLPAVFINAKDRAEQSGNYLEMRTNPLRGTPKISFNISVDAESDYEYIIVEWVMHEFIIISRNELKLFATRKEDGVAKYTNYPSLNIILSRIQREPKEYTIKVYGVKDEHIDGSGNIYVDNFKNIRTVNNELVPNVFNRPDLVSTFVHNMATRKTINPVDNKEIMKIINLY